MATVGSAVEGGKAPDVQLAWEDGTSTRLSALKGRPVVLYFYPKDDTPGCTTEAKDFTSMIDAFRKAGAEVIGISPDSAKSHAKFRAKHDLAVRLASDQDHAIAEAFGSWVEKSMYGRTYMGVDRSTFLIGADGKIARAWRKVKVKGHAEDVLNELKSLDKSSSKT
ncbi:MAG: thioredoxin-dependent thiol peroxidase [Hyphomicrobiaceae bacterium]